MAHSYIQAHDDESQAFSAFADLYPQTTLLVDTYDTIRGVKKVIALSRQLGERFQVGAIRLDSGDLAALAKESRRLLDQGGLHAVRIFASGGLDEYVIDAFTRDNVPIDAYGVGTALAVSQDAPALDMAYKLVEYDNRPRTKLSAQKVIYPGRKQVFRQFEAGAMMGDVLAAAERDIPGERLLRPVMRNGRRLVEERRTLEDSRTFARQELQRLPAEFRSLETFMPSYPVSIDRSLREKLELLKSSLPG
jgi:nicotinate phosphoribosyltransferase